MTAADVVKVAASLKNTHVTALPAQPEVDVPEEGLPVLAGLKKYFDIRFEDGGMWCGLYDGADGTPRQFRFKALSKASRGNWRVIPCDLSASTCAATTPSAAAPNPLRIRLQRFIPCRAASKKQRKATPCMFLTVYSLH